MSDEPSGALRSTDRSREDPAPAAETINLVRVGSIAEVRPAVAAEGFSSPVAYFGLGTLSSPEMVAF